MKGQCCMRRVPQYLFLLAWLISVSIKFGVSGISLVTPNNTIKCISKEREALLQFKHGIQVDRCGLLTSWDAHQDCCQWQGIRCDNRNGHVIRLQLRVTDFYCSLGGKISPSIVELKHLKYLDLSYNAFAQTIPSFIGSLLNLQYLNLSNSDFYGEIPSQFANLSSLISLDLSSNDYNVLDVKSLRWLSHLTLLRDINLSDVDLTLATDWMQVVNNLPFLRSLKMDRCYLFPPTPSSLVYTNSSTTFRVLSLSNNLLDDSSILRWVSNLTRISISLEYLDLSDNEISGAIPSTFGNMHSLLHLDLSANEFQGPIPNIFGNMLSLLYLDLCCNEFQGPIPSAFGKMHSLSYLYLYSNRLQGPLPNTFGNIHSLLHLDLSWNELQGLIPSAFGKMHSLSYLDLSSNVFEGLVPGSIFNLNLLKHLNLSNNNFQGIKLSNSSGNLCSLQQLDLSNNKIVNDVASIIETLGGCANTSLVVLDLSNNSFWGSIPNMIGAFSSLKKLYLDNNHLNGTISLSLGQLSKLKVLDFYSNSLRGTLSSRHLSNMSRLHSLDLHNNPQLMINIGADWVPPYQLHTINLAFCNIPCFPKWLLNPSNLSNINISNSGIFDSIPPSFWNSFSSKLPYLNLDFSHNEIHGVLPDMPPTFNSLSIIDLSSNRIEGSIPSFLGDASALFLNDNRFSGSIASFCPTSEARVQVLDFSNNSLSGELPDCWLGFKFLQIILLDYNNLTGKLPPSMGALDELEYLSLRNNSLNGKLQIPERNWSNLIVLDVGYNSFTGHIAAGIGNKLDAIKILNLRNNKFFGKLPLSLCRLSDLQILDFSHNQISGTIPECICDLQGMTNSTHDRNATKFVFTSLDGYYVEASIPEMIMWKKKEQRFADNWKLLTYMAISDNQLQGQIPTAISCLRGLDSLDFAGNNLTGSIPPNIGELTYLEFLDLSRNHLSGQIPSSLANLNFLGTLNLSYNCLSGKIPTGTQLQSMEPTTYMGNPGLCGPPLPQCTRDPASNNNKPEGDAIPQKENDGNDMFPGLYISVVLGFIVGFWGVCGTLVIKRSWRHTYFRYVEDMYDRLHVMVVVTIARVWRR